MGAERDTKVRSERDGDTSVAFAITSTSKQAAASPPWVVRADAASRTYLGSSGACDIVLVDPHVSRRHLALQVTARGLEIEDLESTNGTFVNGLRTLRAVLAGGETIAIGDHTLRVARATTAVHAEPAAVVRFGTVLGASLTMRRLYPLCQRIATSDVPLLIEGETGTGKEVLAESIHAASSRASGPFVVFDCTTISPTLLEATLFGHEKGAFTGAVSARPGVFELASGGTLFIDEIGDLDTSLQAKLLRALQSSQVQRIGASRWIRTNVRIISATRRDLEREIQVGRFRDDLYFRLVVARIELPPLRQRRDDVPLLARAFWTALGGTAGEYPPSILAGREDYAWPGNVRELHNLVAHRLALGDLADAPAGCEDVVDMPATGTEKAPSVPGPAGAGEDVMDRIIRERRAFARAREQVIFEFERRYTDWVLAEHGGNVTKAAEACGISRRYFYVMRSRRST